MKKILLALAFITILSCNGDLECDVQRLEIIEKYDRYIEGAGNDAEQIRLFKLERELKIEALDC